MAQSVGKCSEMQLSPSCTPSREHLGRLSTSLTTLEAAGTGILQKILSCRRIKSESPLQGS